MVSNYGEETMANLILEVAGLALVTGVAVGYVIGSMRTFAHCRFWSEKADSIANTLLPWCGNPPHWR